MPGCPMPLYCPNYRYRPIQVIQIKEAYARAAPAQLGCDIQHRQRSALDHISEVAGDSGGRNIAPQAIKKLNRRRARDARGPCIGRAR